MGAARIGRVLEMPMAEFKRWLPEADKPLPVAPVAG
jgi:hypothetical protein